MIYEDGKEFYSSMFSSMTDLANEIYKDNAARGWWDDANRHSEGGYGIGDKYLIPIKIALMHSELSEALEGFRRKLYDDHLPHRSMIEVELADTIIRILDCCGYLGLDIGSAIKEKLEYNSIREDHKRENRIKDGGKSV